MLDNGNGPDLMETPEAPPPEEKSNRTFRIVGGIMAGVIFLTLAAMAVYLLVYAPRLNTQRSQAQATIEAGNARIAQQVTQTALAALWTPTPFLTENPTNIPLSSPTPMIALGSPQPTTDVVAAALSTQQTQQSIDLTATAIAISAVSSGSMPKTGFFDEMGLPGMIVLALVLVVVIFLARRMRKTAAK